MYSLPPITEIKNKSSQLQLLTIGFLSGTVEWRSKLDYVCYVSRFCAGFQPDPTKPSQYPSSAPNFDPYYALSGPHCCPRTITNAQNSNPDLYGATKMRSTVCAARLEEIFNFLSVLSLQSQFPLCAQSCTRFFF